MSISGISRRVDRVAVAAFECAHRDAQPVTMALVKRVIAELGDEADGVSAETVYGVAAIWERSVNATRRRARA